MSTITLDDMPAEALRRIERELARRNPGEPVHVTIGDNDALEDPAAPFIELAKRMTRTARERGLTEEMLAEILAENE
ncbi:hypothetical protein [Endothiovibrio diazotrophicus]